MWRWRDIGALLVLFYSYFPPLQLHATLLSFDQETHHLLLWQPMALVPLIWMDLHNNKAVFIDLGIHENFKIPKLHSLIHYASSICLFGTTDNYNTEQTERLLQAPGIARPPPNTSQREWMEEEADTGVG